MSADHLFLVIKVPISGTNEHKRKDAAAIRRTLEVTTHGEVGMWMAYGNEAALFEADLVKVDWPPVDPG